MTLLAIGVGLEAFGAPLVSSALVAPAAGATPLGGLRVGGGGPEHKVKLGGKERGVVLEVPGDEVEHLSDSHGAVVGVEGAALELLSCESCEILAHPETECVYDGNVSRGRLAALEAAGCGARYAMGCGLVEARVDEGALIERGELRALFGDGAAHAEGVSEFGVREVPEQRLHRPGAGTIGVWKGAEHLLSR